MSFKLSNEIKFYYTPNDEDTSGSLHYGTAIFTDGYEIHFIVDCGQYRGKHEELNRTFPFRAERVDVVFVTHPHIDHVGKLPLLKHKGFSGPIYASIGTSVLYPNVIRNSAGIVLSDKNFRRYSLFTFDDVEDTIKNMEAHKKNYDVEYEYKGRLFFTFIQNQHLPGASCIRIRLHDPNPAVEDLILFFEGDYNDSNQFLENSELPKEITDTEISCFFLESTYGDSNTSDIKHYFQDSLIKGLSSYRTIVYLAYALGRTPDILFLLRKNQDTGLITPDYQIYLDGELSKTHTQTYIDNAEELGIREDARDFLPHNLDFVVKERRKHIIRSRAKKIIVTSSGTGTYGPAKQYLTSLISDPETMIVFGGYCTPSSVGGRLMKHKTGDIVNLFGEKLILKATLVYLEDLSGHGRADKQKAFLRKFTVNSVMIVHGDPEKEEALKQAVRDEIHPTRGTHVAERGTTFVITRYGIIKQFRGESKRF